MSRLYVAVLFLASLTSVSQLSAQDLAMKNGFEMTFGFGFPGDHYGEDKGNKLTTDYNMVYSFQIGNRWYIKKWDSDAIGAKVNWFDIGYANRIATRFGQQINTTTLEFSFLEFGPMYTRKINDEMAIDGYYNLRPFTFMVTAAILNDENGRGAYGLKPTHGIGANFRYNVFSVGLEYQFGTIDKANIEENTDGENSTLEAVNLGASMLKINVGIKF